MVNISKSNCFQFLTPWKSKTISHSGLLLASCVRVSSHANLSHLYDVTTFGHAIERAFNLRDFISNSFIKRHLLDYEKCIRSKFGLHHSILYDLVIMNMGKNLWSLADQKIQFKTKQTVIRKKSSILGTSVYKLI